MRIALCFSGQPRTFEECFPYIEDNLIKANPQYEFDMIGYFNSNNDLMYDELKDYPFKSLLVEPDVELPNLTYQDNKYTINYPPRSKAVFYQLYAIQNANKLRKQYEQDNNFEYDFVVRIRPDFKYLDSVDLSNLEFGKIYLPLENDHFGYNDRFAIGSREVMEVYMNRFDFWMKQHPEIVNYTTHIETNLKIWLDINTIPIDRIPFSYCTCRVDGDVEYVFI
jgi:hypothetical protein